MRRTDKLMSAADAWALLHRAPVVHLAASCPDGTPLLRTLHAVVLAGHLYFHGARQGEKNGALGRPAVASAEEILAAIPSHWVDPQRACPATTLYRSAMVHGVVEEVRRVEAVAAVLQALMERYQPEGGYTPISAEAPLYRGSLRGVRVLRLRTERVSGKAALGQHWSEERRQAVREGLWRRGAAGDLEALQAMGGLPGPSGTRLVPCIGREHVAGAVALLRDQYWNQGIDPARIAVAQPGASAWVGALDAQERVLATARALSDGAKLAYVMDVAVHPDWRGRGLGEAIMRLLLDHPRVRGCRRVELHTRDAGSFYEKLGFGPMVDPRWRQGWRLQRASAPGATVGA